MDGADSLIRDQKGQKRSMNSGRGQPSAFAPRAAARQDLASGI